ncbi:MAG: N-acetylmuramoyl-L-alanine amidase [Myxococcales bacterium]|nr:N-acetylmuramoyl-L-alanine amidase [Myxococcales bacterium]
MRSRALVLGLIVAIGIVAIACGRGDRAPDKPPIAVVVDGGAGALDGGALTAVTDAAAALALAPVDAAVDAPLATIVDWPVPWPAERERLMLAYRRLHSDPAATDLTITPRMIVLHYTGGHSAKGTHGYFSRTRIEAERATLRKGGEAGVVSHFLVDRDGTIFRLIPETRMGRHAIGVNHAAIGVENVGDGDRYPLTDAQVAANVALIRDLAARFPIERVLGHHEVATLRGTPAYLELVRGYRNEKGDPGPRFMAAVRAGLGASPLAAPPAPAP